MTTQKVTVGREQLEDWLYALETTDSQDGSKAWNRETKAITAIKEVLAHPEPEQEIVAWMYERARFGPTDLRGQQWKLELSRLKPWTGNGLVRNVKALYTTQPQRKPLTDEIVRKWANDHDISGTLEDAWLAFQCVLNIINDKE